MQRIITSHICLQKATRFILFATISLSFAACKKSSAPLMEALPAGTVLSSGSFVKDAHEVSGNAKITSDGAGNKILQIENFSSDNGPDLRVWLSPNTSGSPYVEAGLLKATAGQVSYALPAGFDHAANNHVLIWCKRFSALFGHAMLK